jgi:hypothetical protein
MEGCKPLVATITSGVVEFMHGGAVRKVVQLIKRTATPWYKSAEERTGHRS